MVIIGCPETVPSETVRRLDGTGERVRSRAGEFAADRLSSVPSSFNVIHPLDRIGSRVTEWAQSCFSRPNKPVGSQERFFLSTATCRQEV